MFTLQDPLQRARAAAAAACTRRGRCSVHAPAQTAIPLLMQSYAKRPADEKINDKCYINVTGT